MVSWLKKTFGRTVYLMDENVKMSQSDIDKLIGCIVINSTDKFKKGTDDRVLTKASKENGWVIVTKDIRMALRSLEDGVPVLFVSDEFKSISYLTANIYGRRKYPRMFDYIHKRFAFTPKEKE